MNYLELLRGKRKLKKVHIYEIKLIDGSMYQGEIIYENAEAIRVRLTDGKLLYTPKNSLMSIKDLGWRKRKS